MAITSKDIPSLLHDARLSDCRWDRHLKTLQLCFQCLRRNSDGTAIDDSTVDLNLGGVERITAYYSPASLLVKPSEFETGYRFTLADLVEWPHGSVEARLAINSLQSEFEAATSCLWETLLGTPDYQHGESPSRVHIFFETHDYGPKATLSSLSIDCDSVEPLTNGVPLDLDTWRDQYEAWWAGWREHWSENGVDDAEEFEVTLEDTLIPGEETDPPDLTYRPPSAAPFLISAPAVPAELLKPIADFHTGLYERDWLRMASAYPFFDQEPDQRAATLREEFLGDDFGRWVYLRHIDGWWSEGNRACLVVRGIEHIKGDGDSAATNEETVVTYGLRRFRQTWVIATWSQGWPAYGSAEKLEEAQSWREGWNLAE